MDGGAVTTLRTAAGSAVAVDLLAVPDACTLAVIGSGVQAKAMSGPFPGFGSWPTSASGARRSGACRPPRSSARAVDSAEEAVAGADIVVTCTLSREPVVRGAWLSPGATGGQRRLVRTDPP